MASGRRLFPDFRDTPAPVSQEARAGKTPAPSDAQRAQSFTADDLVRKVCSDVRSVLTADELADFASVIKAGRRS